MRRKAVIVTLGVLCLTLVAQRIVRAESSTAQEILTKVSHAVDPIQTWSMTVDTTVSVETTFNDPRGTRRDVARYIRFGQRRAMDARAAEIVTTQPRAMDVVGAGRTAIVDGYCITYFDRPNAPAKVALYAPNGAKFVSMALQTAISGEMAMEGRLTDPEPVADALRNCPDLKVSATPEAIDGVNCTVISGHDKYGTLTLWCDAARGYIPLKMQLVKTGKDLYGREAVAAHMFVPNGKARAADSLTYTADHYQFETLGGALVATSCRYVERIDFGDLGHFSSIRDIKRKDINLNPDTKDDKLFKPQLNNGVIMSNQENLKEPYEWMDGKIIPRLPQRLQDTRARAVKPTTQK